MAGEVIEVPLKDLFRPQGLLPRVITGIDRKTVEHYAEILREGGELPPIEVWRHPEDGRWWVVDGHHRWEAHRLLERLTVRARVVECRDERDFALKAFAANIRHGLPLKREEMRTVAKLLAARGVKPAEIARATGLPEPTVRRWVRDEVRETVEELKRRAWDLRGRGWSLRQIARELGVSDSTVHEWLKTPPAEKSPTGETEKKASPERVPENDQMIDFGRRQKTPNTPTGDLSPEEAESIAGAVREAGAELDDILDGDEDLDLFSGKPSEAKEGEAPLDPLEKPVREICHQAELAAYALEKALDILRDVEERDPASADLLSAYLAARLLKSIVAVYSGAPGVKVLGFVRRLAPEWLSDFVSPEETIPETRGAEMSLVEYLRRTEEAERGRKWSYVALVSEYLPRFACFEALERVAAEHLTHAAAEKTMEEAAGAEGEA